MTEKQEKLRELILASGPALSKKMNFADGILILAALAEVESSFGIYAIPRHEKIFDIGGVYCNKDLWKQWGAWAACSYSSWQIMYPVSVELGFPGRPQDLMEDETAIHWVMEYIDKRILAKGCSNLWQFADAYNSGSFRDKVVPTTYIEKFNQAYHSVSKKWDLITEGA